ncbi:uncharacterized protein LOC144602354 [Rhinoraja longicauda]
MRHAVVPGDNVLAPWESDRVRYGPGVVVFGIETRDPLQAMEDDEISVKFWNAKTVNVSKNVAMWIPSAMYKRVLQELLTPLSSRHQLMDNEFTSCRDVYLHGPHVSELAHQCHFEPMCTQSSFSNFPGLDPYHNYWNGFYHGFHCLPVCPPCCCFQEVIPPAGWWPVTPKYINSTTCDKDALDKKVTLQLQELDVPKNKFSEKLLSSPSSASSSEDSDSSLETTVCKPTLEHKGVNSDSLLERSRSKGRGRPEWRYWSQSHQKTHGKKPETSSSPLRGASDSSHLKSSVQLQTLGPTNRCAMFESVDHASSQNRVTMKDVLTYQKHHITSSTGVQCPPIQERLGESQLSHDHQHQEATQRSRMKKLQRRLWEKEREHQCENKYQTIQEKRREKVLHRLQNDFKQMEDEEQKLDKMERAKQCLQQKTRSRIQSIACEEKEKEARRLAHLQQVTARKDMMEAEKMKAVEIKEMQLQQARRKRVEQHNKMVAEKFQEAEKLNEEQETTLKKQQMKHISPF